MTYPMSDPFAGVEIIHAYSRAQAVEDGVLVDVSETAREAGITYAVAMTRAVWDSCVVVPTGADGSPVPCQDEAGRLWDVVYMLAVAIRAGKQREGYRTETVGGMMRLRRAPERDRIVYRLHVVQDSGRCIARADGTSRPEAPRRRLVELQARCGSGDDAAPVITIMLPEED